MLSRKTCPWVKKLYKGEAVKLTRKGSTLETSTRKKAEESRRMKLKTQTSDHSKEDRRHERRRGPRVTPERPDIAIKKMLSGEGKRHLALSKKLRN